MQPILVNESDFETWKRQLLAVYTLKNVEDDKRLRILPAFVSEEILCLSTWDDRATFNSALEKIQEVHRKLNQPDDPIQAFESIKYSSNLIKLSQEVYSYGSHLKASEETMLRKFVSLLPDPLQMAAYQRAPSLQDIKLDALADYLSKLPMPRSVSATKQDEEQAAKYSYQRSVLCYNCGLKNHIARNCSAPRSKCPHCNGKHLAKFCNSSSKNVNGAHA